MWVLQNAYGLIGPFESAESAGAYLDANREKLCLPMSLVLVRKPDDALDAPSP